VRSFLGTPSDQPLDLEEALIAGLSRRQRNKVLRMLRSGSNGPAGGIPTTSPRLRPRNSCAPEAGKDEEAALVFQGAVGEALRVFGSQGLGWRHGGCSGRADH
jgi:hypothetical protein